MAGKAVAKTKEAGLPANLEAEMAVDAGDGLQTIRTEDLAVPFLRILQKMSPQVSKRDGAYIQGAEEGMIMNTVTGEVWDAREGVLVIPCAYNYKYIVWKPREDGGGLVSTHNRDDALPRTEKNERGQDITDEGNILTPTAEHYVLLIDADGRCEQAVIAMSSTQLKNSRKWNSLMAQQTIATKDGMRPAPIYSRVYSLKTKVDSNDKGEWNSWDIELDGVLSEKEAYLVARTFSKAVNAGHVQAKHVSEESAAANNAAAEEAM